MSTNILVFVYHSVIVPFTFNASIDLLPFTICILFDSITLINTMLQFLSFFCPNKLKHKHSTFDLNVAHKLLLCFFDCVFYLVVLIFTFLNIVKHILNHISLIRIKKSEWLFFAFLFVSDLVVFFF